MEFTCKNYYELTELIGYWESGYIVLSCGKMLLPKALTINGKLYQDYEIRALKILCGDAKLAHQSLNIKWEPGTVNQRVVRNKHAVRGGLVEIVSVNNGRVYFIDTDGRDWDWLVDKFCKEFKTLDGVFLMEAKHNAT